MIEEKNLFKIEIIHIDGFEGCEIISRSYMISDECFIEDEDEITRDDVVENDEVFLEYKKYKNIGKITDKEIETLNKFRIL